MRREWIEIQSSVTYVTNNYSLPPCGGSGLKSAELASVINYTNVSLHAEGVD